MNNIKVRLTTLPVNIKGQVAVKNGNYYVFINELYCEDVRWSTLRHEIEHIRLGHLDDPLTYYSDCESVAKLAERHAKHFRKAVEEKSHYTD